MKKTSLFLFLLLITCSGAQDEIVDSQDLSDNIVKDTIVAEVTPTDAIEDNESENTNSSDGCSEKTEVHKCHYIEVQFDKPQQGFSQEIVVATDVPQTVVDEFYEIHTMLNDVIGAYNRYVTVVTTSNEFSQPVFDKLKEIHWDQELTIVDGYLVGAGCLTGSGDWQVFPPDPYALCIMDYDFIEYPHDTAEWDASLAKRRAIIYHGWAHEYFHRYQRAFHYELNMNFYF